MANGGGPACLRLQFLLNEEEINSIQKTLFFSKELLHKIKACVEKYYPETFMLRDLQDAQFRENAYFAVKKIASILGLTQLYHKKI